MCLGVVSQEFHRRLPGGAELDGKDIGAPIHRRLLLLVHRLQSVFQGILTLAKQRVLTVSLSILIPTFTYV